MNKSTPISQLPNVNQNQVFVNDQQRQFITQAQQAISNTTMPQNTQASSDIVNDDDMVVQDILNQINASTGGEQNSDRAPNEHQINVNQLYMQQQAAQQSQQAQQSPQGHFQMPPNMQMGNASGGGGIPPQLLYQMANSNFQIPEQLNNMMPHHLPSGPMDYKSFMYYFADDLKLASLIFIATIIVHFIPLEKFIGRYIALDKIPYHEVLFRAIMISILVIIIKKLAKI